MLKKTVIFIFLIIIIKGSGQNPLNHHADAMEVRFSKTQPLITYTLYVDTNDLSGYKVDIRIRNIPDTFHVAMVSHPEYDDRYWRYVEDMHAESSFGRGNVQREDSSLWKITWHGEELLLHYRIHLPNQVGQHYAWRPSLSSTGGLVGGPHSFMYVVGATLAPSHIKLQLPPGWKVTTGLEPTSDPFTFFAPSTEVLVDAPILIGKFREWIFFEDQVPHLVAYLPLPEATPFDTATFVNGIRQYVKETNKLFGRLPYREYIFMLQDGSFGALEHLNSVTVGVPSSQLAKDPNAYLGTISHEYFHNWNLMRIRPAEYGDVSYKNPPLSRGLWWSEGLTIFYSDLLRRRAHLPVPDSSRIKHLEDLIGWYFESAGNSKISPEKVSLASNAPPGMLGDYSASTHLQGELLGTMLDLIIRDATNDKYSIDDVMRMMMERFSGKQGFRNKDIENITAGVCKCETRSFFQKYVYGNTAIDFNKYLHLIGLQYTIHWKPALSNDGKPEPDTHIYAFQLPGESITKIGITDPLSCWGKAGLHTGNKILTVNGIAVSAPTILRQYIRSVKIGDTAALQVQQPDGIKLIKIVVGGYEQPFIRINEIQDANERQKKLRTAWNNQ